MLTQYVLTNAKPREKDYKVSDGDGLYLLVKTNGSKLWWQKYRFAGNEKAILARGLPGPRPWAGDTPPRRTTLGPDREK